MSAYWANACLESFKEAACCRGANQNARGTQSIRRSSGMREEIDRFRRPRCADCGKVKSHCMYSRNAEQRTGYSVSGRWAGGGERENRGTIWTYVPLATQNRSAQRYAVRARRPSVPLPRIWVCHRECRRPEGACRTIRPIKMHQAAMQAGGIALIRPRRKRDSCSWLDRARSRARASQSGGSR